MDAMIACDEGDDLVAQRAVEGVARAHGRARLVHVVVARKAELLEHDRLAQLARVHGVVAHVPGR